MIKIGPFRIGYDKKEDNPREINFDEKRRKNKEKNFIVKATGIIKNFAYQREDFEYPAHNFDEIKIASISDSYIKTALGKYSSLIFKAGYTLKGDNQKAVDYIKTRWKIMNLSTRNPINMLFEGIAKDIVTYGNCFVLKTRVNPDKIMVNARKVNNKNPVGGYFRLPPETIQIKRDIHGNVLKYRQAIMGEEREYSPDDVIHFYIDKDANSAFGTPRIQAALEDVKMLRRIEGNIISLIYRFAMPMYQWKIGLPEPGMMATNREIEEARNEIARSSLDSTYVTNEKTEIKVIGAENAALDATGYLKYFEARVFAALEVSTIQMGREANKASADSVETQVHDTVKYMQRMIKEKIENDMIYELLLEGGFNPVLKEKDEVNFVFEEISLDTRVKIENHELMKYQSNLITLAEARKAIGKESEVKLDELYQSLIVDRSAREQSDHSYRNSIKLSKEQHKLQMEMKNKEIEAQKYIAKNQPQGEFDGKGNPIKSNIKEKPSGKGMIGNGKPKNQKPNNAASNMANPENQHGKTSVKIKEGLNMKESLSKLGLELSKHKKHFNKIYDKYDNICTKIINEGTSKSYSEKLLKDGFNEIRELLLNEVEKYSIIGMRDAKEQYIAKGFKNKSNLDKTIIIDYDNLIESLDKDLISIRDDISKRLDKGTENAFDTLKYRLRFLIEYFLPKTYHYSFLHSGKHFGVSKARIVFNEGSEDKKKYEEVLDLQEISLDNIPAFHSFCKCTAEFIK